MKAPKPFVKLEQDSVVKNNTDFSSGGRGTVLIGLVMWPLGPIGIYNASLDKGLPNSKDLLKRCD